jgi:hypothetical protein
MFELETFRKINSPLQVVYAEGSATNSSVITRAVINRLLKKFNNFGDGCEGKSQFEI